MSLQHETDFTSDYIMKAVIIYQNPQTAEEARSALQRAAGFPPTHIQWTIRPWRTDMLKFQNTSEEALVDAMDAHLIVFVDDCALLMPSWLQDWMENWAIRRHVGSAALALMRHGNAGLFVPSVTPQLAQFARRHGLSIISDESAISIVDSIVSNDVLPASGRTTSYLTQKYEEMSLSSDSYRGWGLNE